MSSARPISISEKLRIDAETAVTYNVDDPDASVLALHALCAGESVSAMKEPTSPLHASNYASLEGNLSAHLHSIRGFPMLEPQEEYMLAKRWKEHEDHEAAHRLVTSHLRLVAKIAMGYSRRYGLPLSDLISEGNVGVMRAVRRFDPDRGFRLTTYAMWWIRAAIQEYILHSWSLVKMGTTVAQKKLFFNLRRLKGQLQAMDQGDLSPENLKKIATELDVPEADVVSMNRRLAGPDHSLNAPLRSDGAGEWQDWLVDETESQEARLGDRQELRFRRGLLRKALMHLNERERHILGERWLKDNPTTLEDLSQQCGISRERVRQIENVAIRKLNVTVRAQMATKARDGARVSYQCKLETGV